MLVKVIQISIIFFCFRIIIIPFLTKIKINILRQYTISHIANFEYVISLIGLMGKGKTSLSVGIITDLTLVIQQNIYEQLEKYRTRLYHINFSEFNKSFEEYVETNFINHDYKIFETIDTFLKSNNYIDGFNSDLINTEPVFIMLVKYCILYFVLNIRGILVYSKGYLFNRSTNNNALILDDKGLEMITAIQNNNWQFELGVIYFDDEIQISRGNQNSNSKLYKMSGMTITLALIRNMSLGTTYRITTKQISNNEEFQNRSLIGSNIEIENVSTIYTSKKLRILIDGIDDHIKKLVLFYKKIDLFTYNIFHKKNKIVIDEFLSNFTLTNKFYKFIHYYLQMYNNYLFSNGYNIYKIRLYKNSEDVGKENTKVQKFYEKLKLIEPINVVFGNYDTFEYFYKLIMLEKYSSSTIVIPTSNTNHDYTNFAFMNTLDSILDNLYNRK